MLQRLRAGLRKFFFPPHGSPRWMMVLPYAILGILTLFILIGGAYAWDYTNSPAFCGTTCHTMPPEFAAYQVSPHARIACVECHIGREFIGNQIFRKAGDVRHVLATAFKTYEYPIRVKNMRPAPEICEKCHSPEKFSDDSLRSITRFHENMDSYNIYLILKTGGGSKREGLGRGIHWHIESKVFYYPVGLEEQEIPYVKVVQDDGSSIEYMDVESDFDPNAIDQSQLKQMDCITCHNRITHRIYTPEDSIDNALTRGKISPTIPGIRARGVEVLRAGYASQDQALAAIADLENFYKSTYPEFYGSNMDLVAGAVRELQSIYTNSVFLQQKVDWDSHPNNVGHIYSAGCFRCHDGKHLNSNQEAIRLECNVCHSIPVVAGSQDFTANIEISRGPEPESHLNPNWITLHNQAFNETCSNCHTTEDAGGTSNNSFCSNQACHGSVYTFAGFDAPALREILKTQLPTPDPTPVPPPVLGESTFDANIGPLFAAKCTACHGPTASAGLSFLTYASTMQGGLDGPVIVPGDPASSKLILVQSAQHFVNLSLEELDLVTLWIAAGAPEK